MLAEIGLVATFVAFVAALYAIATSVYGAHKHSDALVVSARNAAILTFPLLIIAISTLLAGLLSQQYQISYVWSVTNPYTPTFYRFTALWGSQEGSLLFWSLIMSGFVAAALWLNWKSERRLMPYVIAFTMATLAFFLGLSLFVENPFERYWIAPSNEVVQTALIPAGAVPPSMQRLAETAKGLNPLLRHFGMIIHPPMLYLGFIGFIIPYAFAMAALASGDLSTQWIKATRRWALVAWMFLALGLLLGGRWAYDVLGWGGYWGWDPVENAAFLPFLVGTAFIHSVMIQEKRGMLKLWNMLLVIGTFSAMIFGTFATRSGLVASVHSFARSSIGFPMFLFWAGMTLVSVALILWRHNRGELKDEHAFAGILSRESLFVLNNVIFMALTVAIFWGSFGAPIISELFFNTSIMLGKDYFNTVTPPLFAVLYILMGVAPLSAWGATSLSRLARGMAVPLSLTIISLIALIITGTTMPAALFSYGIVFMAGYVAAYEIYRGAAARRRGLGESWPKAVMTLFGRNRRRHGGYLVHLGITVIGIGVIGSTLFKVETQQTLALGESLELNGYTMRYDNFEGGQIAEDGRVMDIAQVTVSRDGQELATLRPRRDSFINPGGSAMPMTIAGAYSTLENDFYVLLVAWEQMGTGGATFKVYINPLINLVWWGGLILILGTFIAAWPKESALSPALERSEGAQRVGVTA